MKRIAIFVLAAILFPNFAHAVGINGATICCTYDDDMQVSQEFNADTCLCYANKIDGKWSCDACNGGIDCPDTCQTGNWKNSNKGYQYRTICNKFSFCNDVTEYRCAANYYGQSSDGATGCTPCPSSEVGLGKGEPQGYSAAGTTSITGCFIPQDYEICDDGGCFDTPDDCYYNN